MSTLLTHERLIAYRIFISASNRQLTPEDVPRLFDVFSTSRYPRLVIFAHNMLPARDEQWSIELSVESVTVYADTGVYRYRLAVSIGEPLHPIHGTLSIRLHADEADELKGILYLE